jgi:hypothetical protein
MSDGKRKLFYLAMTSMAISKGLAVASPYFLKVAVNALSTGAVVDLNTALLGIAGFGGA